MFPRTETPSLMTDSTGRHCRASSPTKNGPAPSPVDHARIEAAVREILLAVGEDPDREGLQETPARVARMYAEIFSGLHKDPRELLRKTFTQKYDEMVVVKDIRFESICEHHLLPFVGKAHIAYLPRGKIVGLSKLPRVVEVLSRRPQVQEPHHRGGRRPANDRVARSRRRRRSGGVPQLHDHPRHPQTR